MFLTLTLEYLPSAPLNVLLLLPCPWNTLNLPLLQPVSQRVLWLFVQMSISSTRPNVCFLKWGLLCVLDVISCLHVAWPSPWWRKREGGEKKQILWESEVPLCPFMLHKWLYELQGLSLKLTVHECPQGILVQNADSCPCHHPPATPLFSPFWCVDLRWGPEVCVFAGTPGDILIQVIWGHFWEALVSN